MGKAKGPKGKKASAAAAPADAPKTVEDSALLKAAALEAELAKVQAGNDEGKNVRIAVLKDGIQKARNLAAGVGA